jgi:hypothetical protein
MRSSTRQKIRVALAIGMLLWLPFGTLEEVLLKAGVLNTKDLPPFVGNEPGSLKEYALNVWHWDAMTLLLGVLGAGCFLALLVMVVSQRMTRHAENA